MVQPNVTFQKESFLAIMAELPEMFYSHWEELESDLEEIPIDVDWERYINADRAGTLHILTARDGAALIGYAFFFVANSTHSKITKKAVSDIFYLKPEYRKGTIGWRFIDEMKNMVRDLGAKKVYIIEKVKGSIAPLLLRKGLKLEESVYSMVL